MTIENSISIVLHEVFSVGNTPEPDVYVLDIDITDLNNERYRCIYNSRPDDTFGLNPTIRQWLTDNEGEYEVLPYVPPTAEQIRAGLQPITRRQLRLTLVRNGFSLDSIVGIIAGLPNGQAKDEAQIEWDDATTFDRLNPTLLTIASALELSPETVDTMWNEALAA
ncbi:hypothetical protein [Shinella sp.]|uniref:hypothetical protein n=1 Tax=Shinella sp. TaxID=1870904 RepID=UPI00403727C0